MIRHTLVVAVLFSVVGCATTGNSTNRESDLTLHTSCVMHLGVEVCAYEALYTNGSTKEGILYGGGLLAPMASLGAGIAVGVGLGNSGDNVSVQGGGDVSQTTTNTVSPHVKQSVAVPFKHGYKPKVKW